MEVGTNFDSLGHAVTTMMIWSLRRKLAVFWHLSQLLEVHSAQHSVSFDEFYYRLKFTISDKKKKLVKSWQCNINEKYILLSFDETFWMWNDSKIRQNYNCAQLRLTELLLPPSGCIYSLWNLQHSTIIWSRKKSWPLLEICHDYCPSKAAILSADSLLACSLCWEMSKRKWPNWLSRGSLAHCSVKARVALLQNDLGLGLEFEGAGVPESVIAQYRNVQQDHFYSTQIN